MRLSAPTAIVPAAVRSEPRRDSRRAPKMLPSRLSALSTAELLPDPVGFTSRPGNCYHDIFASSSNVSNWPISAGEAKLI